MKQLNLVPEATRQKAAQAELVPYLSIAILVGAGVVFALWFSVQIQKESTTERLQLLQSSASQSKVASTVTLDADTTKRVTALNALAKGDIDWGKAFSLVQAITPNDVSLTSFSYASTTSGMTITIVGVAPSNVSFASFAESIQGNKKFISNKVTAYTYDPVKGSVSFSMDLTVPFEQLKFSL